MNLLRSFRLMVLALLLVLWAGTVVAQAPKIILVPENFQTIQAAIDAAAEGDIIFISSGTYRENLTIAKSLSLEGVNPGRVILKGVEEGQPVILVQNEGPIEVKVAGLTITGAKGDCADYERGICPAGLIALGKPYLTLKGVRILDNEWSGIWLRDSAQGELRSSDISGNGDGIVLWHSTRMLIEGNRITKNEGQGVYVDGSAWATIRANTIQNNQECGIRSYSEIEVEGEENHMSSNGTDLCGNLLAQLRVPLHPEKEAEIQFPSEEYPTLQEAVDALKPGGVITIAEGIYDGGITVWKPLTLQGRGQEVVMLKGQATNPVLSLIKGAKGVVVKGLTLGGGSHGILMGANAQGELTAVGIFRNWFGVVLLDSAQAKINNSKISNNLFGILLQDNTQAELTNTKVSNSPRVSGLGGYGVILSGLAQATIMNSVISKNEGVGIALLDKAQATIESSAISEYKRFGILLFDEARASIQDNDIFKSPSGSGILMKDSTQATIKYNRIFDNYDDGIDLLGSALADILNNEISYNKLDGIYVKNLARATIIDNLIFDNSYDGIVLNGKSITYIRGNKILNHPYMGVTAFTKDCGYPFGKETFEATVRGGDNEIYDNEWDVCPWELWFLEETKGGEYIPEGSSQEDPEQEQDTCAPSITLSSSSPEEVTIFESLARIEGDLRCLSIDEEVRRGR